MSSQSIVEKIHSLLISRGETLAVAESCTGGGIASRIVALAGSSQYFEGGVVSYSNSSKENLLGVLFDDIERYGAVSEEVALQMAEGARRAFGATYGVATTGIAGPAGGSDYKPVGTVWFGISTPEGSFAKMVNCGSERAEVIERAVEYALSLLLNTVV